MAEVHPVSARSRLRHQVTGPLRLWKSSLTLRVVLSALLGSTLVLAAAGFSLLGRVTESTVENSRASATALAEEAMTEIEQQARSVGYDYASSDAFYSLMLSATTRGSASGRYQVQFVTGVGTFSAGNLDASIPASLVAAVAAASTGERLSEPTTVVRANGSTAPGLVVAGAISGGGLERFSVFFVFSFEDEARNLAVVQTAAALAGVILLVGIGLVAYVVSRQTLKPLRAARRAAERLSNGELTQLMPVKGTDDLAQLAGSMNHMANQLQQRIRQLEQLSRIQQRFVSDVSHELRTPLTTVRMAADVLYDNRDGLPAVEHKSVELLHKEVNRFEALLGDLLEISRFDAGVAVLDLDDVSVADLVRGETEALTELAATTGSELRLHGEGEAMARVDPRRISRLVRNLISNAIEHGEGRPIDVWVAADDAVVAFAVRDHGVGFTIDQAKQMFNRFWRADPARARHIGGTGLGLSISQEDVRLHQGWI
ncbi:MAG: HAMP domain-containing histidine kinase, partial [Propionibacteriaceae bacterium]|nr:HAMP domain-containing histidine kinase [Propionibacteriaceae bacterium]